VRTFSGSTTVGLARLLLGAASASHWEPDTQFLGVAKKAWPSPVVILKAKPTVFHRELKAPRLKRLGVLEFGWVHPLIPGHDRYLDSFAMRFPA